MRKAVTLLRFRYIARLNYDERCSIGLFAGDTLSLDRIGAAEAIACFIAFRHLQVLPAEYTTPGDAIWQDMFGRRYSPFVVPAGWSELVATCRANRPRIEDSVAVTHPLVARAISRWARAVDSVGSRAEVPVFPVAKGA